MSHHLEKNVITGNPQIVIDGFEKGASDSPQFGVADMRNINNDSAPGIAQCNYALVQVSQTPITAINFVANTGDNTINFTGTKLIQGSAGTGGIGVAITFAGSSLPNPLVAGTIYYAVADVTGLKATIYASYDQFNGPNSLITLTTTGSGVMTFSTLNPTQFTGYTSDPRTGIYYLLDSSGQVWTITSTGNPPVLITGNILGQGQGIAVYKNFLFVFRATHVDAYGDLTQTSFTWTDKFSDLTSSGHYAKWDQNENVLYFCNKSNVGSISQTPAGSEGTLATYSDNPTALTLPLTEVTSYLEEPSIDSPNGTLIYVGTSTSNLIYVWDKHSTGTLAPLVMPEIGTYAMLNINKIVYILAGQRGNIYYTNGSTVVHFSSVPKYSTNFPYPSFTWGGIMSLNNNFCFGTTNATGTANNSAGVWSITLALGQLLNSVAGAIRYKNQPSTGLRLPNVLIPLSDGLNFYCCSFNGTNGVVDVLSSSSNVGSGPTFYSYNSNPAINQGSYLETEIIPIGTAINPKNLTVIEAKLDTPLTAGEKFRICMRSNLSASYVTAFEQTTTGAIDGNNANTGVSLEDLKWVQFRADLQSTGNPGSFVRLKEIRFNI